MWTLGARLSQEVSVYPPDGHVRPCQWNVPLVNRDMNWRPRDAEDWNPQYRPPVALALCLRFYEPQVHRVEELLEANTNPQIDISPDGVATRNSLAANVRIAQALMKAWPNLPDEIPNLPPDALGRKDVLTNDVYQTARQCYVMETQDFWYEWTWPMQYRSTFPECIPKERFEICYLIDKKFKRTRIGRPVWWVARTSAAMDTMSD